jgi:hypothetical protein
MATFTAGMNTPGEMPAPDNVADFDSFVDAQEYVISLLESDAEYVAMTTDDSDEIDDLENAMDEVRDWEPQAYNNAYVGDYVYWIHDAGAG